MIAYLCAFDHLGSYKSITLFQEGHTSIFYTGRLSFISWWSCLQYGWSSYHHSDRKFRLHMVLVDRKHNMKGFDLHHRFLDWVDHWCHHHLKQMIYWLDSWNHYLSCNTLLMEKVELQVPFVHLDLNSRLVEEIVHDLGYCYFWNWKLGLSCKQYLHP